MEMNKVLEIDIQKCFKALKKSTNFIILVTLVFFLLGILAGLFLKSKNDQYKATATVYNTSYTNSGTQQTSMEQLSGIFKTRSVAERASEIMNDNKIKADKILSMVSSYYSSDSNEAAIMYINAYASNEDTAVKVANAAADAFVLEVADLTGEDDVQTLDKAISATKNYDASRSRIKTIIMVTVFGFVLACGYIVLREVLSPRMYSTTDATAYGTLDIIGVIPDFKAKRD